MSKNKSIPRTSKSRNWRKHLSQQRRIARYNASIEAVKVETRLRMRLSRQALDELEARWQALPDLDACFPEQRLNFLLHEEAAMDEARENAKQEAFLRLTEEVGLADAAARRVIASIERQARLLQ